MKAHWHENIAHHQSARKETTQARLPDDNQSLVGLHPIVSHDRIRDTTVHPRPRDSPPSCLNNQPPNPHFCRPPPPPGGRQRLPQPPCPLAADPPPFVTLPTGLPWMVPLHCFRHALHIHPPRTPAARVGRKTTAGGRPP